MTLAINERTRDDYLKYSTASTALMDYATNGV